VAGLRNARDVLVHLSYNQQARGPTLTASAWTSNRSLTVYDHFDEFSTQSLLNHHKLMDSAQRHLLTEPQTCLEELV
jgi:hypothetical protein